MKLRRDFLSYFAWQRYVFHEAKVEGWQGQEPSVLGHHYAEAAFESALDHLARKGIYDAD